MADFLTGFGARQTFRNRALPHQIVLARVGDHLTVGCVCGCLPVPSAGDDIADDWAAYNRLAHDQVRGLFYPVDPRTGRTNWWMPHMDMADLEGST